ncbi:MAG TPA: hypothetical protein VMS56_07495 [Thermoanaerobaculia bacterium]|nr:hypothetical protein [Thermoanaerobaculia bacterium]
MRRAIIVPSMLLLLGLAAPGLAQQRTAFGTGHSPIAEAGPGLDLLAWNDGTAIRASRIDSAGRAMDVPPLVVGSVSSPSSPGLAWDGGAFVVAWWDGAALRARRIDAGGGRGPLLSATPSRPATDLAVGSSGDGSAVVFLGPARARALIGTESIELDEPDASGGLAMDGEEVAIEWTGERYLGLSRGRWLADGCSEPRCIVAAGFDREARALTGPSIVAEEAASGSLSTAVAGGVLVSWLGLGSRDTEMQLLRFPSPGSRGGRSATRVPFPLRLRSGWTPFATGGKLLFLIDDDLVLREATLFDVETGERVAALLSHSGAVVVAPRSGSGTLTIQRPAPARFDVAIRPVFAAPDRVWVKIENRGPDSPDAIHLWVRGEVRSFSSLGGGRIEESGPLSLIRFPGQLHKGAGYEVSLSLREPIDPERFEAWVWAAGTDLDATNNRLGPEAEVPPDAPSRRRPLGRP